ncbi:MAG: hypothetical protein GMKNLPBB_01906 [Myxococcota bacterium]|nr:hypothetical protein [Myxococcota bacterium]
MQVSNQPAPGLRWRSGGGIFAKRLEPSDLPGKLQTGVLVEHGAVAMLFVDGRYEGRLEPGFHQLRAETGLLGKALDFFTRAKQYAVVVIDAGLNGVSMGFPDLITSDNIKVWAGGEFFLSVENPSVFHVNLMKGRDAYSLEELNRAILPEMQNAMQVFIKGKKYADLIGSEEIKSELLYVLSTQLPNTFNQMGLKVTRVGGLNFRSPEMEGLQNELMAKNVEYARRQQELDGLSRDIEQRRARADLMQQMQEVLTAEKIAQLERDDQLAEYMSALDTKKLLRDHEKEELVRGLREKKEDAQLQREFLVSRLRAQHQVEISELNDDYARAKRLKDQQAEIEITEKWSKVGLNNLAETMKLDDQRKQANHEREMEKQRTEAGLKAKALEAITNSNVDAGKAAAIAAVISGTTPAPPVQTVGGFPGVIPPAGMYPAGARARCPACQHENPIEGRFCASCGARLRA